MACRTRKWTVSWEVTPSTLGALPNTRITPVSPKDTPSVIKDSSCTALVNGSATRISVTPLYMVMRKGPVSVTPIKSPIVVSVLCAASRTRWARSP